MRSRKNSFISLGFRFYSGLGMAALVSGCAPERTFSSNLAMDALVIGSAPETLNPKPYGLGMDALVVGCAGE